MARGVAGAIGKFFKGAAEVGVPAALEQHRANILAKRDAILQGYEMVAQEKQNEFTRGENDRQRTLTREENEADRKAREAEFGVTSGLAAEGVRIQGEGLELERQRLGATLAQAQQALESGEIELDQARQIQSLYEIAIDPQADPAERQQAIESLDTLRGEDGRFSAVYFDKLDEGGFPTGGRDTFIMNNRSGSLTNPLGAISGATTAGPKVGDIVDGHEFLGGNPNDQASWKRVTR